MVSKTIFLFFAISWALCAHARTASSPGSESKASCTQAIVWSPCPGASHSDCASFKVPLDYAHPEVGDATLAVARINATAQPRLGTLFTNPGGPGGSGVGFLLGRGGRIVSTITSGQYDIISWDPRGVNQTVPQLSCGFTSLASLEQFFGNSIVVNGIEARGNFTDQSDLDAFFAKANETDAQLSAAGQRCLDTDGSFLKYMGTTSVVRDMVSLSDCIQGPQTPIDFYGVSYGTVIGNYFVNMFPEVGAQLGVTVLSSPTDGIADQRVGRVVIDGVVDTIAWSTEPSYKDFDTILGSADSVFAGFAEQCALAGPRNCAIADQNSTASSVAQAVVDLINMAYDLHKSGKSSLASFDIRSIMRSQLYTPTTWGADLAPQLKAWEILLANETASNSTLGDVLSPQSDFRMLLSRQDSNTSVASGVQELISSVVITCIDSIDQEHVQTSRVFEEVVRVTHDLSPMFGEILVSSDRFFCHRFPVRAVERFTGPFNHKLAHPILVIGNEADPTTPLANARRVAATLGDSARLLVQNGLGHTSLAENSDCTQSVMRDYFLRGLLPEPGTVCETDQALFPPNNTLISPVSML